MKKKIFIAATCLTLVMPLSAHAQKGNVRKAVEVVSLYLGWCPLAAVFWAYANL